MPTPQDTEQDNLPFQKASSSITPLTANQFLLKIYRRTELNWNANDEDIIHAGYSFFASRIKLKYGDISQLSDRELNTKLLAREPTYTNNYLSLSGSLIYQFTRFPYLNTVENKISNSLAILTPQEQSDIERYANQGNPQLQLIYAFLCLSRKDTINAKYYLEQSAKQYPVANFILLSKKLSGARNWGIAADKTEAVRGLDELRTQGKLYRNLCTELLSRAISTKVIQKSDLSRELKSQIDSINQERNQLSSRGIMSYSLP